MTSPSCTSISDRPPLGPVCRRAVLFLLPALLFFGAFEALFWRTRECWPASWIIGAFARDPQTLYGPRYFAPKMHEVKLQILQRGGVEVFALGSSRVTQFRGLMLRPWEERLLNGGMLVSSAPELVAFGQRFLDGELPLPPILVVGIDPWWMKRGLKEPPVKEVAGDSGGAAHIQAMRTALTRGKIPWSLLRPGVPLRDHLYGRNALGLGALSGNSYRADGSVLLTDWIIEYRRDGRYRDREIPPVIERIRAASHQFRATPGIDWEQAEMVIQMLVRLQARGCEVGVFLPPFSTEADRALRDSGQLSTWYAEYRTEFASRVEKAGLPCANVASPATYGLTDEYMIDGFHPGEVLITHVVEDLAARAAIGRRFSGLDRAHLQRLRQAPDVLPISLDPPPPAR